MALIYKQFSKQAGCDVWHINIRIAGARVRRGGFRTKKEADEAITALKNRANSEMYGIVLKQAPPTLGELLEQRESDFATETYDKRRLLIYFRQFVEDTGHRLPIRDIRTIHLKAFRDSLVAGGYANATVTVRMGGVLAALNSSKMYFEELETFRAPSLPGLPVERRDRLVAREELIAMVEYLRSDSAYMAERSRFADTLELLMLTGARANEILSVKPKHIDFSRKLLTLYGKKINQYRTFPMSGTVERILAAKPVFTGYNTLAICLTRAGRRSELGFGRSDGGWSAHDLRHTAASVLAERGIAMPVVAALLGHSLSGMTARYTHATLPGLKTATAELEAYYLGQTSRRLYAVA